jgi:hypothetical protein
MLTVGSAPSCMAEPWIYVLMNHRLNTQISTEASAKIIVSDLHVIIKFYSWGGPSLMMPTLSCWRLCGYRWEGKSPTCKWSRHLQLAWGFLLTQLGHQHVWCPYPLPCQTDSTNTQVCHEYNYTYVHVHVHVHVCTALYPEHRHLCLTISHQRHRCTCIDAPSIVKPISTCTCMYMYATTTVSHALTCVRTNLPQQIHKVLWNITIMRQAVRQSRIKKS